MFLATQVDRLTGKLITWRTLQNKRSRGEIAKAEEIFLNADGRIAIMRDQFLGWLFTSLRQPQRPPRRPPRPKPRGVRGGAGIGFEQS